MLWSFFHSNISIQNTGFSIAHLLVFEGSMPASFMGKIYLDDMQHNPGVGEPTGPVAQASTNLPTLAAVTATALAPTPAPQAPGPQAPQGPGDAGS